MAKGLTQRQHTILTFVMDYIQKEGFPPSIREIGKQFGIGSLRGVTVHLDALERKGFINRQNTPRSIKITHPAFQSSQRVVMLPLIGQIAAGSPIMAQEQREDLIAIPREMVRNIDGAFLLRVRGDSMTGDGILPRDLVVVKPQQVASHNDLVAVMIEDEAAIKRIHFGENQIRLISSNPSYDPILADPQNVQIVGRIIGLVRDYEGMAF